MVLYRRFANLPSCLVLSVCLPVSLSVCLSVLDCRTKALVLELLAAVCLVRGGHEIILSAFDNFKTVSLSQ